MDCKQFHLKGNGFSGRGVRLRELDQPELDAAFRSAAKLAGTEGTMADVRVLEQHECVTRMIVEVTEKPVAELDESTKWRKVTQQELDDEGGPFSFGKLFKAKDTAFLRRLHRDWHNLSEAEIEAIAGKAQEVSVD
jgi:hypothetical protein